jgi:basic membrane protein A
MALPTLKTDQGFSQAHYQGLLTAAKSLPITVSVLDNAGAPTKAVNALKALAQDNKLVIGVGAQFAQAGVVVAKQFKDVTFLIINGQTAPGSPNLHVYFVRQGVPAYVAGVLAGKLTKTKHVGFIGGAQIPPLTQSDDAFKAVAKRSMPSVKYSSTVVGDFDDVVKAKVAAQTQIAAGADALFAFVNKGLQGVIQAVNASGKDVQVFDIIFPHCTTSPRIVGTAILDSGALVNVMINDYLHHRLTSKPRAYGVDNQKIQRFQLCPGFSKRFNSVVRTMQAGINAGRIKLPRGV